MGKLREEGYGKILRAAWLANFPCIFLQLRYNEYCKRGVHEWAERGLFAPTRNLIWIMPT